MTDQANASVRVSHRFRAPAEHVYDAWLDPERASKFLFATPNGWASVLPFRACLYLDPTGTRIAWARFCGDMSDSVGLVRRSSRTHEK